MQLWRDFGTQHWVQLRGHFRMQLRMQSWFEL
jgi:hypothetical protein